MKNILVVDDERDICMLLSRFLKKNGFDAKTAISGAEGLKILSQENFDLVICDFKLPDTDGFDMLQKIKNIRPATQVILITGYADVRMAVQALKRGAFDYVTKPLFPDELLHTIKTALQTTTETNPKSTPQESKTSAKPTEFVSGKSPQSALMQKHIALIAPTEMTVILLGETGTGKEFAAREIHAQSKRKKKPFVAVDCGALPNELAGSELFGHQKGAFTGALQNKKGCFENANKGTLFLDEIGNLSYENQVKLLRVLQEHEVKPLGSDQPISIDVRVIVATNENMTQAIADGSFREDLFHRLNEFKIELSPLRNRQDDLEIFTQHFLHIANAELQKNVIGFSDEAFEKLKNHAWPGNLRELRNVVKRCVLLCEGEKIGANILPMEILSPTHTENLGEPNGNIAPRKLKDIAQEAERNAILNTLQLTNNNKSKTADMLEIDRKTLYNKMRELNINL